jgi:hypothetical protein
MRSRRYLGANRAMHGMMVMQRRWLRVLSVPGWNAVYATSLSCRDHRTRPTFIGWVVEQPANIMNKEWIELIRDLFLVGEIQCSIEWNP